MKQEEIIRIAIESARAGGLRIVRGPLFEWHEGKIIACDATGAVLLALKAELAIKKIPLLCKALEVDAFWIRRFWMGWDRGYQVMVEKVDETKQLRDGPMPTKLITDEVSKLAIKLAREYCLRNE